MEDLPRDLHGAAAPRRVRAFALGLERAANLPSGDALTGEDDLIVFPSNHQLVAARARHAGIDAAASSGRAGRRGLIVRRDSPNGKRYARKDGAGEIELAFGFDLSPLVVRSEEFESLAADM